MKIAILDTSNDTSSLMHGRVRDSMLFQHIINTHEPQWQCDIFYLWQGQYPPSVNVADAYIITGSPASVNDNEAWIAFLLQFIQQLHQHQKKTVGICFGHQAIAKALGGIVDYSPNGWCIGLETMHYHQHQAWMRPKHHSLQLYAVHQQQIIKASNDIIVLGGNENCPIGCMAVQEHFFGIAYHPEFDKEFLQHLCRTLKGRVAQDILDKAYIDFQQDSESHIFIEWMMHFLHTAA